MDTPRLACHIKIIGICLLCIIFTSSTAMQISQLDRYYNGSSTAVMVIYDVAIEPNTEEYDQGILIIEGMIEYFASKHDNMTTVNNDTERNNQLDIHVIDMGGKDNNLTKAMDIANKYFTNATIDMQTKILIILSDATSFNATNPATNLTMLEMANNMRKNGVVILMFSQTSPTNKAPGAELVRMIDFYGFVNFTQVLDNFEEQNSPDSEEDL